MYIPVADDFLSLLLLAGMAWLAYKMIYVWPEKRKSRKLDEYFRQKHEREMKEKREYLRRLEESKSSN